jgi:hypothetical protein
VANKHIRRTTNLEQFILSMQKNIEATIFCTENAEDLTYLATLYFLTAKRILTAQVGSQAAKDLLQAKLEEFTIAD